MPLNPLKCKKQPFSVSNGSQAFVEEFVNMNTTMTKLSPANFFSARKPTESSFTELFFENELVEGYFEVGLFQFCCILFGHHCHGRVGELSDDLLRRRPPSSDQKAPADTSDNSRNTETQRGAHAVSKSKSTLFARCCMYDGYMNRIKHER